MTDLVTLAENKLDSLIASDDPNTPPAGDDPTPPTDDGEQDPPAGGDDTPPTDEDDDQPNGDNDDGQGDDPNKNPSGDEEEDDPQKPNSEADAGKPKGDEASKPLTDDELIAELEKRGLKVDKKEAEDIDKQKPVTIERPEELPQNIWNNMQPVQKHIYNELPYITLQGKDAEGNDLEINVKTPDQIPDDFEFANKRAEKIADNAFLEQNKRADDMYAKIQTSAQTQKQQDARRAESNAIVEGIEALQEDGTVPKIAAKPGTPEFNDDPGVKRANEILKYREALIAKGEQVSVVSAGKMYRADHPDLYVVKPTTSKGDAERKKTANNINGGGRGTPAAAAKNNNDRSKYPIGMSLSDIADLAGRDLD